MYCVQCEQTVRTPAGKGCAHVQGVCGKTDETADLQDLLIAALQSLSAWTLKAREYGADCEESDRFAPVALFSTLTNVNFDSDRIIDYTRHAIALRDQLKNACLAQDAAVALDHPRADLTLAGDDKQTLRQQAAAYSLNPQGKDADAHGVYLLCLYGLKGAAAYLEHSHALGQFSPALCEQFHQFLAWLGNPVMETAALLEQALAIGKMNFAIMAQLDNAEVSRFGHPEPCRVNTRPVAGKAILVSGHDLTDLYNLLKQTEGTGINIYTHGEMLPAHSYPELRKFPHLVGNYGSAWQNQQKEFASFPGPIIMTSNCIISPAPGGYTDRIWTRNMVGWPGVKHLTGQDFSAVIAQAQQLPGFPHTEIERMITIGFGRQTLLNAADSIIELVAQQKLRHVFLIGGCDGHSKKRDYYGDFARQVPQDCAIMTLGCGKYRLNGYDFGTLEGGLPRLLDVGQCNDAYAAITLAVKLAEKLGCGVNDLPLTLVLSWFEQKAIVILLTLLALGVKNIFTGPTLPAFLSDNVCALLQSEFGLKTPGDVAADMQQILQTEAA